MGDYSINILNVEYQTSDFLDTMYSNSFFPTINTPTRISTTSRTLMTIWFIMKLLKISHQEILQPLFLIT